MWCVFFFSTVSVGWEEEGLLQAACWEYREERGKMVVGREAKEDRPPARQKEGGWRDVSYGGLEEEEEEA